MTPPPTLLEAATELLQYLPELTRITLPEQFWHDAVARLVSSTQANAARLEFAEPTIPPVTVGDLDTPGQAWFEGRLSRQAPPFSQPEVHDTTGVRLLLIAVGSPSGALLGHLALGFAPDRDLPPQQCSLLAASVGQLAAAASASWELRDTYERLNRFRHLYEVGQALTSTLDLDQVLRQSTARVAEVLHAEASTLFLVDEPRRELVFKVPAGPAERILQERRMPMEKGVAGWAAAHGQPVIIGDVQADQRFYEDIDRTTGFRTHSIMAVPLQVKGRTIGVVEVINKLGGGAFSNDDLQWLSILAPLVAVAIDNARLFAQERQRVSELQAANAIAAVLNETLDLTAMLRVVLRTTMDVLDAEAGEVVLRSAGTAALAHAVRENVDGIVAVGDPSNEEDGLTAWILGHGQSLIMPDLDYDTRARHLRTTYPHVHSYAGVPLIAHEDVIGVLSVLSTRSAAFDSGQMTLLNTIGRQIGMAVENARLYVALREERDNIIAAEEKVRHELARSLHDGPAQIMAAIILNIDMARRQLASKPDKMATELNFLESLAQEANQEVRDLLFNLRPVSLEAHGLVAALAQLVERIQSHAPYDLHLDVQLLPAQAIDPKVAGTLFVIVQEALNNIQKHASPRNVWVRLGVTLDQLWIEVEDDGTGFNVAEVDATYARRNSFGLLNMRERARLIDGQTRILSPRPESGNGTRVRVDLPLTRACPPPTA